MRSHISNSNYGKTRQKIQQIHHVKLFKLIDNTVSETIYLLESLKTETKSVAVDFHYSFIPTTKQRVKALKTEPQLASSDMFPT